jgi:hypothetical protein
VLDSVPLGHAASHVQVINTHSVHLFNYLPANRLKWSLCTCGSPIAVPKQAIYPVATTTASTWTLFLLLLLLLDQKCTPNAGEV